MELEEKLTEKIRRLNTNKPVSFVVKDFNEVLKLYEELIVELKNKLGYAESYSEELEIENKGLKEELNETKFHLAQTQGYEADELARNRELEGKILQWYAENGKKKKFGEYFGISSAKSGNAKVTDFQEPISANEARNTDSEE